MPDQSRSVRFYRWLVGLYPVGFRESYSGPLERAFRDELAQTRGAWGLARLWIRLLADLALSLPAQLLREALQDGRHALRLWSRHPLHTAFAVAALAIGIGAATGGFSVVNTLLLTSLPFHDPERLASFHPGEFIPPHDSAEQFHEWRQQSTYLADAALVEEGEVNLGAADRAMRAHAAISSWNLFAALGTTAALGRTFLAGEDSPGRNKVAVIGYGLWQQLFAGDRGIVGSTIRVNGQPLTIVGVAPPGFDYPRDTVLWQPAEFKPGNNGWATVARLKPGLTWQQAHAAFDADASRLSPPRPQPQFPRPRMRPLQQALTGSAGGASLMLLAGAVLVLLIACTNVANLLMARLAGRTSELSVRSALGASRGRLTQQLLTECLLLSALGALSGFLVAAVITFIAAKIQPPPLSAMSYSLFDGRVLAFSSIVSVLAAVLFGVLPFLSISHAHRFEIRGSGGGRRGSRLVSPLLIATQVIFTVMLLSASLSVGRALVQLLEQDRGYEVAGVVTVNVSLEGTVHQTDRRQLRYFEEALARIRRLPGVRSASATEFLPLHATGFIGGGFGVDGRRASRNSTMVPTLSDYFRTMGGRILEGREFTDAEVAAGSRVAVVNERFAASFGGPRDVLGRQLTIGRGNGWKIVGVVRGMEFETDASLARSNQVFVPAENPGGFFSTFVVKVDGRAENQVPPVREAIRSVDPHVPVFGAKTMERRLSEFFIRPRAYRTAVWVFAGFAILLALVGLYGIVSHTVMERTREMGLRMALGATPRQVRRMLLVESSLVIAAGAVLGVGGARLAGRFLESLVQGAQPVDLPASAAVALSLSAAAAITIWTATRRIPRLDLMEIMRTE